MAGAHASRPNGAEPAGRAGAKWLAPRRVVAVFVGTVAGGILVGGLFEVVGLPQLAAPCFVVAMFLPLLATVVLLPIGLHAVTWVGSPTRGAGSSLDGGTARGPHGFGARVPKASTRPAST